MTHFQRGTFEEKYWLHAHEKRRESALFKSNKKLIRDDCGADTRATDAGRFPGKRPGSGTARLLCQQLHTSLREKINGKFRPRL